MKPPLTSLLHAFLTNAGNLPLALGKPVWEATKNASMQKNNPERTSETNCYELLK